MARFTRYQQSLLAFAFLLSSIGHILVNANITIPRPISSQLPPVAYTGTSYTFTLATGTFAFTVPQDSQAPPSPPTIAYSAQNLPSWLSFDASTLTFTGTPPPQDAGETVRIPVEGSIATSASSSGNTSAIDVFHLPILNDAQPAVNIPITQQLTSASSLGPSYMIAPDTIHIPQGWSFSVGLNGDTFTIATGQNVYWSANLADGSPLPNWLHFSSDTYDFYGVASQSGEFDVVITGSGVPGYGGVTQIFKLVVGSNALMLGGNGLSQINASVGTYFQYQIPLNKLQRNGKTLSNSTSLTVNVSLPSSLSWLTFQADNNTLSGIPPYNPYGNASSTTIVKVPVTFTDSSTSNNLTVNQAIAIQPSLFIALVLPNLFINQGQPVSLSLKQYLRNSTSSRRRGLSKRRTIPILAQNESTTPNVTVSYNPENTSSWLHFDPTALTLSGQVPQQWKENSQITLDAPGTGGDSSQASLYLAFQGDPEYGNPVNSTNGQSNANTHQNHKNVLSKTAKIAIGASLGAVGALIALILLFTCCRRRYDSDFDRSGQQDNVRIRDDDEGTLTDQPKDRKWKKAIVIGRAGVGEVHTPSTVVPSPMPGFNEKDLDKDITPIQPDLHSVVVVSPNGRRRNAMDEAEPPMQSRLIANLFGGGHGDHEKASKKRNSKMAQSVSNGTGLGLSMGDSGEIDPFANPGGSGIPSRIRHQRSRESVKSHRSSWESDLFYEDAPSSQQHQSSAEEHAGHFDQNDDLPRRRGKANVRSTAGLNVRHRNTHINESPAFHTQDVFVPDSVVASNSSRSNLEGVGMAAMDSVLSMGDDYQDTQTGYTPGRLGESDARILKARVMQVQRHSPILHQGSNNPFTSQSITRPGGNTGSMRAYNVDGEAFDDAEDDDEWPASEGHGFSQKMARKPQGQDKRTSVMSAMTDSSQLAGVRAHFANEAAMEAEASRSPFMDGASISAFDPRDTVKSVMTRPQTPPLSTGNQTRYIGGGPVTPKTPKRATGSFGSAASGRFLPCPTVDAIIGHLLRFKMYPNVPPPLAGATGSPGKRSGRTVRYELVMLDDRPHLMKYKNTWPAMLSDWLSIDNATFEVEGVVPKLVELEQLGDCEIALISTTRISGNPNSPERQTNNKRSSVSSYESGGRQSISNDEERTVVARARLIFQNPAPRIFIPRHGQAF